MYGLDFTSGTNSLICGNAHFKLSYRDQSKRDVSLKMYMAPADWNLERYNWQTGKWETIARNHDEVIAMLTTMWPKKDDFDVDWDWPKFMLALTFFDEGRKSGMEAAYKD